MVGPTNPSEEHFHRGLWGFDGNVWRKLQLLFGFGGVVEGSVSNTSLDAGANTLPGDTVPSGEIWIIENIAVTYVGTPPTSFRVAAIGLAGGITLFTESSVVSGVYTSWGGRVTLQAGDHLAAIVAGATDGDALYFHYAGYRMEIE